MESPTVKHKRVRAVKSKPRRCDISKSTLSENLMRLFINRLNLCDATLKKKILFLT